MKQVHRRGRSRSWTLSDTRGGAGQAGVRDACCAKAPVVGLCVDVVMSTRPQLLSLALAFAGPINLELAWSRRLQVYAMDNARAVETRNTRRGRLRWRWRLGPVPRCRPPRHSQAKKTSSVVSSYSPDGRDAVIARVHVARDTAERDPTTSQAVARWR